MELCFGEYSERMMVAWPLYSEQKKEEIAEMVKRVMDEEEGKEMKENVKELKMKTAEEAFMKLSASGCLLHSKLISK